MAGVSAMVPEGLVLLTSIAFAAGAIRLASRHVLVQELAAIEGLARVDVLCIDKTGTLTSPEMEVHDLRVIGGLEGVAEAALGALAASDPAPNATIHALAERFPAPPGWSVSTRVPFSSERKWSAVSFGDRGSWILGAPDMIVPSLPDALSAAAAAAQAAGRRVLLLAASAGSMDGPMLPASLEPVALLVLSESLRSDAATTVSYLIDQGITVKVLSGDAPNTVAAVAGQVGIAVGDAPCDAAELASGGASMGTALDATNVFGRVRPEQKLEAVRSLQSSGHVVAMVGDGVNDVQALKQADLGIAMGSGSQSSRSVARVVLLDSSFAAMPQVLAEGRRVIANIERVANLFVTKTAYAAILAVAVAITAVQYPFFPRHLTVVSTVTIGVPGFFLAFAAGAPRASPGFTRRVLVVRDPRGRRRRGSDLRQLRHRACMAECHHRRGPHGGHAGVDSGRAVGAHPGRQAAPPAARGVVGLHGGRGGVALRIAFQPQHRRHRIPPARGCSGRSLRRRGLDRPTDPVASRGPLSRAPSSMSQGRHDVAGRVLDLDRIDACIFDLDGVLTDTASLHQRAWADVFDQLFDDRTVVPDRVPPFTEDDYRSLVDGESREDGARNVLRDRRIDLPEGSPHDPREARTVQGIAADKDARYLALLDRDGARPFPSSVRLLERLQHEGVEIGVVSASSHCAQVLDAAGLTSLVDVRVDGEVARAMALPGKPDPRSSSRPLTGWARSRAEPPCSRTPRRASRPVGGAASRS